MASTRCQRPKATKRVFNAGTGRGPQAWCPGCKSWQSAEQVPWGQELWNRAKDKIIATYAPKPH
jgi:hypothetical protein